MQGELLYKADWVSLVKINEYECLSEPDVVFIFAKKDDKYVCRFEFCPSYFSDKEENYYTVISGKIDEGETPRQSAVRELKEEAGISIKEEDLQDSFMNIPVCKSSTMRTNMFYVDLDEVDHEIIDIVGDGTENEKKSETLWLSFDEMIQILDTNKFDLLFLFSMMFYKEVQ